MNRVIISTPSLNIEIWNDLYRFIDSIYNNDTDKNKTDALFDLKNGRIKEKGIKEGDIKVWCADGSNSDVYKLDGKELTDDEVKQLSKYTCYTILYQNKESIEEYTGLAPFVFFLRRFKEEKDIRSLVSLGIGTDGIKDQSTIDSFYFKCSNFFCLYDIPKPVLGEKTIYFFSTTNTKTRILAGIGKDSRYPGNPNRRFLPLLPITGENYQSIFTTSGKSTSKQARDYTYVNDSLNLIKKSIRQKRISKFAPITDYTDSLFGQWLINGYFNSYDNSELMKMSPDDIKGTIQTLQIYRISIFELIQNIIFHGGKDGLFYCAFDKKENVSSYYQNKLPDLGDNASRVNRFLRVGIYDFHETGIVDSFKEREKKAKTEGTGETPDDMSLVDFFDTESIKTIGITELEMRYAASLGIKSFVRTVFKHKGYFSVESNQVVNGHNSKKRINSIWKDGKLGFPPESIINDNVAGTHYEIILPVMPTEDHTIYSPQIQRNSILNFRKTLEEELSSNNPILALDLDFDKVAMISNCTTKQKQIYAIKKIGNEIIERVGRNRIEIALNLNGKEFDHNLVFKIIAYLQLRPENDFRKIILFNGKEDFVSDFCEIINPLLSDSIDDNVSIWNKNAAIILMSEKLHVQIICGETKGELYSLNQEFKKYYCNNFTEKDELRFNLAGYHSHTSIDDIPKDFILPYDILIESSDGTTPFETYALDLIKRKIISNDLGFLVNHENTYIGNKIIVKNYYEADLMFQNSFFSERYAYLIAKNIRKLKRKDLVLIGYQQYSEYLLKAIKRILNDNSIHIAMAIANDETARERAKDQITTCETSCNESTNEEKQSLDIVLSFNFDIDGNNSALRDNILKSPEKFQFATIVPIGATLSTNDKIVALFKLWHKLHNPKKSESTNIDFIYNHCVIIVRDKIDREPTPLEKEQQWKEIQLDQNLIETDFRNATEIHYTIQTAKADNPTDNNWLKRLNKKVSFPQKWVEEKYVNLTENSSINSQNLMGFPKVDTCDCNHQEELNRLFLFKDDIYKGHFDAFKSHHKYFFDTESFVRKGNNKFNKWLSEELKTKPVFNQNNINIIITPNAETESDLVCAVNDQIFDGNALIIYLDVKNWRNNIVYKLSFLKHIDSGKVKVSFHYVDHLLLTGETYHRTKSYLYSIIGNQYKKKNVNKNQEQENQQQDNQFRIFDSIITVINRLPITSCKEIKDDVNHFYAFINLYYPTSKLDGRECELCKLQRYYDDLSKRTVLDSCKQVIKKNVDKLICKSRKELELSREKRDTQKINRYFLRLVLTHELYYRISRIAWGQANKPFDLTKDEIYAELDAIYCKLCNKECTVNKNTESDINDRINGWYKSNFPKEYSDLITYYNQKLETDKKISFLKVISSPPLSKYIIIRQYAHSKLLDVLYEIIKDNNENENKNENIYDDLKIIKSILKSLSFLKSNALVRKDVIVGVWKILGKAHKHLSDDLTIINNRIGDCEYLIKSIKNKQTELLRTGNRIPQLMKQEKEAKEYSVYLEKEKQHLEQLITKDEIIKDFSRDYQFFIKNAIVEDDAKATFLGELIRQGEEIHSFDNIKISKTKLSTKVHNNQNDKNDLFNLFPNESFRKEYIDFLVWLFYDNTTIIRKTLANFSMELKKDSDFNLLFKNYIREKKEYKLKTINDFKFCVFEIEKELYKKINHEYYYSSFKPYLNNGDGFDFIRKLIYLTYAKLKLEDITRDHHIIGIETDTKILLEVFAKVMGADAAFLTVTISGEKNPHTFSKFNCDWKNDNWMLDHFYTFQIHSYKNIQYPFITKYDLQDPKQRDPKQTQIYGEGGLPNIHSLGIMVIDNNENNKERKPVEASITFLYNNYNDLIQDQTHFRIHTQESGRLLLLLKNEIYSYIIQYLKKEKIFDIWLEKDRSYRKFEKIYANSSHTFNSVYDEMEEFEHCDPGIIPQVFKTWYFLSNQTISFIYSNIEKNRFIGRDAKNCITLENEFVIDRNNTCGKTFNGTFISLLSSLLDGRWNFGIKDNEKSSIAINNQDIHDFKIDETLSEIKVPIKKQLLQTIIVQCLNNSLSTSPKHGHRAEEEIKRINITIKKDSPSSSSKHGRKAQEKIKMSNILYIIIEDQYLKEAYTNKQKEIRANRFKKKRKLIKQMKCDAYSSTTLTTLQGVINFMNELDIKCNCEYGFNTDNNFVVTIKLTEQ